MRKGIDMRHTVTVGGDLVVGNVGYGAMQLAGPKVTSVQHLHENADAAHIDLTVDQVDAITALVSEAP